MPTPQELARALDPEGKINAYWEALGQFVSAFSLVEANMQIALWRVAGVEAPVGKAIWTGGARIDTAITLINRLATAHQWAEAEKTELTDVFQQLGTINKVRNDLLHHGAQLSGTDEWISSNVLVAHAAESIRRTKVSAAILTDMTADLHKIILHLARLGWRGATFCVSARSGRDSRPRMAV